MPLTLIHQRDLFLDSLKSHYIAQYEHLQPCPYLRDKHLSIDNFFVDRDIEIMTEEHEDSWQSLPSCSEIIGGNWDQSKVRVLEALPGYGKTVIFHKLAFDWCNNVEHSPVSKIDILLFFKVRHLVGVNSVAQAVRRFLLPKASALTEKDINHILLEARSVVILLDNFDSYSHIMNENITHILDITRSNELKVEQIITTRTSHVLSQYTKDITRLRLTALDNKMQEVYIRKVVVGNDSDTAHRIKQCLQNEAVLVEICKVPLFFATFAHFSYETLLNKGRFVSVYQLFEKLVSCFFSQLSDDDDDDENITSLSKSEHQKLGALAFVGLYDGYPISGWDTEEVVQKLGQESFDKYLRLGILCHIEEEGTEENPTKRVTFYYKVFSEWYAAFYLAGKLTDSNEPSIPDDPVEDTGEDILDNLYPQDCHYLLRFTCAHSPVAAKKIIQHLRVIDDYGTFVVICGLEQNVETVKAPLQEICSKTVHIGVQESELTQSSTIQLAVVASSLDIPIAGLWLNNCFKFVDRSKDELVLAHDLRIPILSSLELLWVENRIKEFTKEEIYDIIDFSSKCNKLTTLKFDYSVLPRDIDVSYLTVFQSRNVKVHWCGNNGWFRLDLQRGRWRRRDSDVLITDEEYDREVKSFWEFFTW